MQTSLRQLLNATVSFSALSILRTSPTFSKGRSYVGGRKPREGAHGLHPNKQLHPGKVQMPIGRYTIFPRTLARIQNGPLVRLRDYTVQKSQGSFSFDLTLQSSSQYPEGVVLPFEGTHYEYPNGCSLRPPSSRTLQNIARAFNPRQAYIFVVPQGKELPEGLVLLHEHSDHFAIQCSKPMRLTELDEKLTRFFHSEGEMFRMKGFVEKFPFK